MEYLPQQKEPCVWSIYAEVVWEWKTFQCGAEYRLKPLSFLVNNQGVNCVWTAVLISWILRVQSLRGTSHQMSGMDTLSLCSHFITPNVGQRHTQKKKKNSPNVDQVLIHHWKTRSQILKRDSCLRQWAPLFLIFHPYLNFSLTLESFNRTRVEDTRDSSHGDVLTVLSLMRKARHVWKDFHTHFLVNTACPRQIYHEQKPLSLRIVNQLCSRGETPESCLWSLGCLLTLGSGWDRGRCYEQEPDLLET